jgi:hypothetical protein
MNDLRRIERIVTGDDPLVRKRLARETTLDLTGDRCARLREEHRQLKERLDIEAEYRQRNPVQPQELPFRIPQLWGQADQIEAPEDPDG